eukprot:281847-Heterocapsa_arctica.AAC.1
MAPVIPPPRPPPSRPPSPQNVPPPFHHTHPPPKPQGSPYVRPMFAPPRPMCLQHQTACYPRDCAACAELMTWYNAWGSWPVPRGN